MPGIELKPSTFEDIVSRNMQLLNAKRLAQEAAAHEHGMLIVGEAGTEKELFARAVHSASARSRAELVELDCLNLPGTLLEQMLFGPMPGLPGQPLLGRCVGGTFFIQEAGALPLVAQSRIIRALESGKLPLASGSEIDFDCRLLASASQDLAPMVEDRSFRSDLFRILTGTVVYIPPLRHRKEDIPLLVERAMNEYGSSLGKHLTNISDEAMHALMHYRWPGNVRELRAVVRRSAMLARGETILLQHLPQAVQESRHAKTGPPPEGAHESEPLTLAIIEKRHIQKVLDYTGWHKVRTAQILGIDRSTLYDKIKRYNLVNNAERSLELSEA